MKSAVRLPHNRSLGVGGIIGDSFSVLFEKFFKFMAAGLICVLSGSALVLLGIGLFFVIDISVLRVLGAEVVGVGIVLALLLLNAAVNGMIIGLSIQITYDAKLGRNNSIGTYFRSVFPTLGPIIVLNIIVSLLAALGALALIIGAFWVYAVFCATVPAIVIERAGFGAMTRSMGLTKGYRWPIAGALFVMLVIMALLSWVGSLVGGAVTLLPAGAGLLTYLGGLIEIAIIGQSYVLGGISIALIYARLRELKEGVNVDEIAAVFE